MGRITWAGSWTHIYIHTCQCCVIEFHTPILPVWLVATSWLPIKNKASTGTLRLNVPVNKQFQSSIKREARRVWRVVQRVIEYLLFHVFWAGFMNSNHFHTSCKFCQSMDEVLLRCDHKDKSSYLLALTFFTRYRKIPKISPSKYKPPKPVT